MKPCANTLGILVHHQNILVEEQCDKHSKGKGFYYRPIGGTIEFGEHSQQTLVREFQEELGVEVTIQRYVQCIENIFGIDGNIGHEITQIYLVAFCDHSLYEVEQFQVNEGAKVTLAKWIPIADFENGRKALYPAGLIDSVKDFI